MSMRFVMISGNYDYVAGFKEIPEKKKVSTFRKCENIMVKLLRVTALLTTNLLP